MRYNRVCILPGEEETMKQFTFDDRLRIQEGLTTNNNYSQIARDIGKNRTSISREVKAHLQEKGKPARSKCKHRKECIFEDQTMCPVPNCTKRACSTACSKCAEYCDRYEPIICPKLLRPPYVCNGCADRANCYLLKRFYFAEHAHEEYRLTLSDSRTGICLTREQIRQIETTVIPLVKNGVSLPVAYSEYADSMPVSLRTLYDYISKGVFNIDNTELRRKVFRKPNRQKSGPVLHVDKKCHVGRTYADFLAFTKANQNFAICEMDTVEGRKGGKVILTIFLRNCDLQIMFLRDTKTAAEVTAAYDLLRRKLGDDFVDIFRVVLADRGTEFSDPGAIELNPETGEYDCNVFYCDPQQTNQKSRCERNHEYIRYILPKGTSFDDLTQDDIDLVMNNVNSMPRGKLNAKSPVQVFMSLYGEEIAARLGLKYVPLEQLYLKPDLLNK